MVIGVKPLHRMYRRETLAKAIGALKYFGPRGIGYLLVDATGRTLADLAYIPYDMAAAEELESLFHRGPVRFRTVRDTLARSKGGFKFKAFASMVVNRDWAVTSEALVQVWKLTDGLSFRPLFPPS